MEHNELSMLLFETPPASPASGTTERSRLRKTALRRAQRRSVNIHMVVHVVMCAEKCLWPLQLSVHFAAQLAGIIPTPAPPNKDFFFCIATLCSTHNTSSRRCQAVQIKLGLNKMYLHSCMQKSSQQLTFLSAVGRLWRITSVRANPRRRTLLMAVAGTPQKGAHALPAERSEMSINGGCQFQRGKLVICKRKRCMST